MLIIVLVWSLLGISSIYAALAGGTAGRIGAALTVSATVATMFAERLGPWTETHFPILIIDLLLLAALFMLAMRSQVYWPIWAAGFHMISVTGHAATMIMPDFKASIYSSFNGMWAIFVQMAMVWGITLDRFYLISGPHGDHSTV
jgi:hypothetical protein